MKLEKIIAFLALTFGVVVIVYQSDKNIQNDEISYNEFYTPPHPIEEVNNPSPYATFGDSSFVLMTEQERSDNHVLEITNNHRGKLSIDFKTGIAKLFDETDKLVKEIDLPAGTFTRFLTTDRFTEKYPTFSPYHYAANNPILNIDINGDSVAVANNLYNYPLQAYAFELFAATPEGGQYIRDRAHKGFEFQGQYVKDLHIKANKEGKVSKNGIDITFQVGGITAKNNPDGQTLYHVDLASQRLKMTFALDQIPNGNISDNEAVLSTVDTWTHESFYHGDYVERSFFNIKNNTPFPIWNGGSKTGLYKIPGFNSGSHNNAARDLPNSLYANERFGGYSLLKRTAKRLRLPYTRKQIWSDVMMKGF